jgi:hypothetical protein
MENLRVLGEQWLYDLQMEKYKESVFEKRPEHTNALTALEYRLTEFYNKHNPMANIPAIMENIRVLGEQWLYDMQMEKYKESVFEKRPEASDGTTADHLLEYRLKKFYQTHNQAMIDEIPAMIKGIREYGERHYHMEMMKKYGASIFDYPERSVNAMKTVLEMTKDAMKTIPETTTVLATTPVSFMYHVRECVHWIKIGALLFWYMLVCVVWLRMTYHVYQSGMFGRLGCFVNPTCPLDSVL